MAAQYHSLPARLLHNLYALLYQKAAFEVTEHTTGEGIIWARSSWTGSQRYPVHWSGDAACTWDGMAGSLRGGLHLGLSGFAFWSHDVPGFHGVPNFMNSWPSDDLYVRWTQFGVFSSHIRYHGAQPREPYEYPVVADVVRQWWRLRYCLIPYLAQQGTQAVSSGLPVLRALVFHDAGDPTCWHVDDQFLCGDVFLVAPVMNDHGTRDIYLPEGTWTDFWTGEVLYGPRWLHNVTMPLSRLPLYARTGSRVPVYPEVVNSTNDMSPDETIELVFDESYRGLEQSVLGHVVAL
jgi:alpha-D-xyloside xylohydrolase